MLMSEMERMEVSAELVQRMGEINAYEVTGTVISTVYATSAAQAISMALEGMKEAK